MPETAESIIRAEQIKTIIDECLDGVAKSKVGPIKRPPRGDEPNVREVIDNISLQTYMVVLSNVFPKNMEGKMSVKEGEG